MYDHHSVRELFDGAGMSHFLPFPVDPLVVQPPIDVGGGQEYIEIESIPFNSARFEHIETGTAAVRTRSVPCRERRRFVEKEQFRVGTRSHDRVLVALERQYAADPGLVLPAPGEQTLAVRVVDDAAIAHQRAAGGNGNDVAEGVHSITQCHRIGWVGGRVYWFLDVGKP